MTRIRTTARRLYNSAILMVLPEVEDVLTLIAKAVSFLERREAALERHIEASIEAIVEDGKDHRNALARINRYYDLRNAANLTAIGKARKDAEAAVAARTAVENLINNRG